jgi:acetylornithine deacetylase/succinyl-diaminopimelate desuccinylase-like protein
VIGIDAPSISESSNVLIPRAASKISLRISPDADPQHELRILMDHLRAVAPWNVHVDVREVNISQGFICHTSGPRFAAARRALEIAFEKPVLEMGAGYSIPILRVLQNAMSQAEFVLCGVGDIACSHIHGNNESVDIDDLERMIVAQCLFLELLANIH